MRCWWTCILRAVQLDSRFITVTAACIIQAVMVGSMFAYGVFFTFIEQELGWSRTLLSASMSTAVLVMGVGAIAAGQLNDRLGPRGIMLVSGLCYALGYALLSIVEAPWQLYLFFGVLIGIGLSTHDVVTLSVVARSFARRRGTMTGVVKVGTATGQIILPIAASLLIASVGWREACLVFGAVAAGLLSAAALSMRIHTPPPQAGDTNAISDDGMPFAQAVRSRAMWTLAVTQFAFMPALLAIPLHLPVHGVDLGMSSAEAAALLSTIGASSIAGRLVIGTSSDRIGGRQALLISLSVMTVALAALVYAHTPWLLFAIAIVYGFAHGGLFTVVSPTIAEYFGMRAHSSIFGVILFFGTIGASVGPLAAGRAYDLTGSYGYAFGGLSALAFFAFLLVASLPRRQVH